MSWAIQTEWMDEREYNDFQAQLDADPSKPRPLLSGERALMNLMKGMKGPQ